VMANDFKYALVLLIDVLEHFEKDEGKNLLRNLLERNEGVLISTPKQPGDQKDVFDNKYEIHRSKWSQADLMEYQSTIFVPDRVSYIVYIGEEEKVIKLKRIMLSRKFRAFPYLPSIYDRGIAKLRRLKLNLSDDSSLKR
jgi:hypothetical protein